MKISEADLTKESLLAAAHYVKETQQEGLSILEKSQITTQIAHGFFMGVRWKEEQDGKAQSIANEPSPT